MRALFLELMMLAWDLAKKLLRFLLVLVGIERVNELGLGRLILR